LTFLKHLGAKDQRGRLPALAQPNQAAAAHRVAALIAWLPIVRVGDLVKDRRPPEAAALRAVLDKIANTNRNAVQAIKAAF
jgi:hypothetical protein